MKLYHGSPQKLDSLEPRPAKGINDFQNQKAIFCGDNFEIAALFAIGKQLKRITSFGVNKKLVIVGNYELNPGYVYEFETNNFKKHKKEYAVFEKITKMKTCVVKPEDYKDKIFFIDNKDKLYKSLGIKPPKK